MQRTATALAAIVVILNLSAPAVCGQGLDSASRLMGEGKWKKAAEVCRKILEENPNNADAWFELSHAHYGGRDFPAAIEASLMAAEFPAVRAPSLYNLACVYALDGQKDAALEALERARYAGFADRELMQRDSDLESIRDDPRFALPGPRLYFDLDVKGRGSISYSVDLPSDFDEQESYPVLIGPGAGEPSDDRQRSLFWGEDSAQRGWIVVESMAWLEEDPVGTTAALLDVIERRYHVEGGKFHVAGFSANSAGAFEVALGIPERIHTITGLPGYPRSASDEDLQRLANVRVNFLVGSEDEFWLTKSEEMHERLTSLGVDAGLEVIEGGEHVLKELFGGEFMDWLAEQRALVTVADPSGG